MAKKSILAAGLAAAALSGCGKEKAHYDEVERKAVTYFKDKYGDDVTIVSSIRAGNSGLFGFIGVDDRAYEMSDGTMVYWNDEEQYFADNRQAAEIAEALRTEVMEPAIAEMDPEARVTQYTFNRTGMDSFDEMVFRGYFDGDIEKLTAAEEVNLRDLTAVVHESAYRAKIEKFFDTMDKYFSGYGGGTVVVFKDFVLEPGDVTLEPAGSAPDLQKKLDDAYYALPVDAEENKNGGYSARDQRHESRVILTDAEAPVYRLCFSDRVREQVTEENTNYSFYILMDSPDVPELWRYIGEERYSYTIFRIGEYEPNPERARLHSVKEGDLIYVGGVTFEKLGE